MNKTSTRKEDNNFGDKISINKTMLTEKGKRPSRQPKKLIDEYQPPTSINDHDLVKQSDPCPPTHRTPKKHGQNNEQETQDDIVNTLKKKARTHRTEDDLSETTKIMSPLRREMIKWLDCQTGLNEVNKLCKQYGEIQATKEDQIETHRLLKKLINCLEKNLSNDEIISEAGNQMTPQPKQNTVSANNYSYLSSDNEKQQKRPIVQERLIAEIKTYLSVTVSNLQKQMNKNMQELLELQSKKQMRQLELMITEQKELKNTISENTKKLEEQHQLKVKELEKVMARKDKNLLEIQTELKNKEVKEHRFSKLEKELACKNMEITGLRKELKEKEDKIYILNSTLLAEVKNKDGNGQISNPTAAIRTKPKSTIIIKGKSQEANANELLNCLSYENPEPDIRITKIQKKQNTLEVRTATESEKEDLKKKLLTNEKIKENYYIEDKQPRQTKLIFFRIPSNTEEEQLFKALDLSSSLDSPNHALVTCIKRTRNESYYNWIILINRKKAISLLQENNKYLGFRRIKFAKYISASRCFRCQSFFHKLRHCRSELYCQYCGGEHEVSNCEATKPRCVNCSETNKYDNTEYPTNPAPNDPNCPFYKDYKLSLYQSNHL